MNEFEQQIMIRVRVLIEHGCEPTSAIKQVASDFGVRFGKPMKKMVEKLLKFL